MLGAAVVWLGAPAALLGAVALHPTVRGMCQRVLHLHMLLALVVSVAYSLLRERFRYNLREPPPSRVDGRCREFAHEGMRVLTYTPPRPAERALLVLPGVTNSPRRMMRYDFVAEWLLDSALVVAQPRGFGESADIHADRMTLMQDSIAAYELAFSLGLPIHVLGFSAGAFMAAQLAAALDMHAVESVVLVGGMFSCDDVRADMKIPAVCLGMQADRLTDQIGQPVVLVHSRDDAHIRPSEAIRHQKHRAALGLPTTLVWVRGPHHAYVLDRATRRRTFRAAVRARARPPAARP